MANQCDVDDVCVVCNRQLNRQWVETENGRAHRHCSLVQNCKDGDEIGEEIPKRRKRARASNEGQFYPSSDSHPVAPLNAKRVVETTPMVASDTSCTADCASLLNADTAVRVMRTIQNHRIASMRQLPTSCVDSFRLAITFALSAYNAAVDTTERHCWLILFLCAPKLLLSCPKRGGKRGAQQLASWLATADVWQKAVTKFFAGAQQECKFNASCQTDDRVVNLVRHGRYKAAMSVLKERPQLIVNDALVSQLASLHPRRYDTHIRQPDSHGEHGDHQSHALIVANDIDMRLKKCKSNRSSGLTGWTKDNMG